MTETRTAQQYAEEMMQAMERCADSPRTSDRRSHFNAAMVAFRGYLSTKGEEHRAAMSAARDAALEEAAQMVANEWGKPDVAEAIRALQSAPAQVVSIGAVRRAMADAHLSPLQREEMCRSLGVDLDVTGGAVKDPMCACGDPRSMHDGDGKRWKPRLDGGWRETCAGFAPAPEAP